MGPRYWHPWIYDLHLGGYDTLIQGVTVLGWSGREDVEMYQPHTFSPGYMERTNHLITRHARPLLVANRLGGPLDDATWAVLFATYASITVVVMSAHRLYRKWRPSIVEENVDASEIVLRLLGTLTEPDNIPWFLSFSAGALCNT